MKIAVGLSGGVDSSVAAALLIEQGHEVTGVTMKHAQGNLYKSMPGVTAYFGGDEEEEIREAEAVAEKLGIPFLVIDLTKEYEEIVLDYFREEYLAGRTPNPCVRCNQQIKFTLLMDRCMEKIPFDAFATGHYARVEEDEETGRMLLKQAAYRRKDQSYFLSQLSQDQLRKVIFPLGHLTKEEVRAAAASYGLPTADKEESQDFFAGDYRELFPEKPQPGSIVDMEGKILGRHSGIISYTIGQRRGLGISAPEPLYVIRIDAEQNEVVVGPKKALLKRSLTADQFNWISQPAPDTSEGPLRVQAKSATDPGCMLLQLTLWRGTGFSSFLKMNLKRSLRGRRRCCIRTMS